MGFFSKLEHSTQFFVMRLDFILRFIPRLVIGLVFIPAGWGKLQSMSRSIEYFSSLNIPVATMVAPIVALLEILCGFLILVGLYTRVACLPLIAIMMVAISTAHKLEFTGLMAFAQMNQGLYTVILICIFAMGSGTFSVEQMIFRRK